MAKKSPASSQPELLKRVKSEDIWSKPLTKTEMETLRRHAARQAAGDDSLIDFRDIPPLSKEQLARMVRAREVRPPKISVSVRLDPQILDWLKKKGHGHLTRINDILANVMEAEQRIRNK